MSSESRFDTVADIVASGALAAIAIVAMQAGFDELIVLNCIVAIGGLNGYKMARRTPSTKST
jgi:hypothetical protein